MDQSSSNPPNIPVTKRIWRIVRIVFFMIRKGIISKSKLMLDLRHLMSKRGKLAGKALGNLMFHHHHHHHHHGPAEGGDRHLSFVPPKDYEFSCSNSPALPYSYFSSSSSPRNKKHANHYFSPMRPSNSSDDDVVNFATMHKILEMLTNSEAASPAAVMRRSSPSPLVRQLRITDSPFPLRNDDEDYDGRVDQQAEMFIERFYEQLKQQARLTALEVGARR
ncbi:hypothetical protein Sjap_019580 [Stephania japonica]|uniref:Avr9/Cf-9 rapidly elicited protein n=1 Tax=Stephania japonica TaxID=461633 RepID=A0AAP0F0E1_9MAGN